jgi:hypothetical protein
MVIPRARQVPTCFLQYVTHGPSLICRVPGLIAVAFLTTCGGSPETAERKRTDLHPNSGKQIKEQTMNDAGISTSPAHRCEQLADYLALLATFRRRAT